MYKILVSDPLEATGLAMLRESGHEVYEMAPEERDKLPELIADCDAIVVRSGTQVTAELLDAGKRLRVVGRAGIGVDNVDVAAATERGILVVNAPTANLLSATEHTFALLLALARNVPAANAGLKNERWDRKKYVGYELQGKTLGVIGFGRIGQRVARRAQAFDMNVLAYDPFLDAEVCRRMDVGACELDDLLARADVITLHVPLTDGTRNLLDGERIAKMKQGALLVNCARGGVVDEDALLAALESGRVAGAGVDVFAVEPPTDYALASHPNVVATPHLGAQTKEAQVRISTDTAKMVLKALDGSLAVTAVNLPFRPAGSAGEPYLLLGERLGHLAGSLLEGALKEITVELWGIEKEMQTPVSVAAIKGALGRIHGDAVNYVNAEKIARDRGVSVVVAQHSEVVDYPQQLRIRLEGGGQSISFTGTLFHDTDPRVVSFNDYIPQFRPKDYLLFVRNQDVPGVVGKVGTLLGEAGLNIADIHLARSSGSPEAVAVVRLDGAPSEDVVDSLRALPEVVSAQVVDAGRA